MPQGCRGRPQLHSVRLAACIGDECGAHTFPYIEVKNKRRPPSSTRRPPRRSAKTSSSTASQRGISEEDAVSMIVNGFCKEVLRELPMEFAVEAQKLLGVSLEGAVG